MNCPGIPNGSCINFHLIGKINRGESIPYGELNIYILKIFMWLSIIIEQLHYEDLSSFLHNKLDKYAQQDKSFSSISNTFSAFI